MIDEKSDGHNDDPPVDGPSGADDDPDLGSSSQDTPGGEHGEPETGRQSPRS